MNENEAIKKALIRAKSKMKVSVSITTELDDALEIMCIRTGLNKSQVIENILRNDEFIIEILRGLKAEYTLNLPNGLLAFKPNEDEDKK